MALTRAKHASTRFTYPRWVKGGVNLGTVFFWHC